MPIFADLVDTNSWNIKYLKIYSWKCADIVRAIAYSDPLQCFVQRVSKLIVAVDILLTYDRRKQSIDSFKLQQFSNCWFLSNTHYALQFLYDSLSLKFNLFLHCIPCTSTCILNVSQFPHLHPKEACFIYPDCLPTDRWSCYRVQDIQCICCLGVLNPICQLCSHQLIPG